MAAAWPYGCGQPAYCFKVFSPSTSENNLRKFLISHAYACCYLPGCQAIHDSDAENANSGEHQ